MEGVVDYRNIHDMLKETFTSYPEKDGYLVITGRIKELIITSGGKNIAKENIQFTNFNELLEVPKGDRSTL